MSVPTTRPPRIRRHWRHLPVLVLIAAFGLAVSSASAREDSPVERLEQLNEAGNHADAFTLGQEQFEAHAGDPDFDLAFGIAALESGEPDHALLAFERVLMHDPGAPLPRLELARAHFAMGSTIAARRHFSRVLERDPPPPSTVIRRIEWFLTAIEEREAGRPAPVRDAVTRWHLGARLGHDSNVGAHTDDDVALFGVLPLQLPDPESDRFFELYGGFAHQRQTSDRRGWFLQGGLEGRGYHSERDFDRYTARLRGGPVLLGDGWRLTLPLELRHTRRDDDVRNTRATAGAEWTLRPGRPLEYTLFGQVSRVQHKPGNARDVDGGAVGARVSWRPDPRLRVFGGTLAGEERPRRSRGEHFGRRYAGLQAGAGWAVDEHHRIDLRLDHLVSRHREDDPAFLDRRRDRLNRARLGWAWDPAPDWRLELSVEHADNDSSLDLYSYRRTQVTAGVRREW
ncbi:MULTISPECIES: tetratricopeptide repeat protein [unclassified Thioalkalivibrio]|uniref:tetratricopeptide repeat protein n=1 Tax=unclassified Thioalkalivibrio TaxID=2621013 RepID=UPI00036EAFE7|nr:MULTISPECIES: tetratricopeptide repeat protein [unclassified Thioalkalivibrio]